MCQVALAKLGRPPIDPLLEPTPPAAPPGGEAPGTNQPAHRQGILHGKLRTARY